MMMRRLLGLVTIAALSSGPALGRSLPKSDPVPALRPCPEMGEGFVRLPGSDTCVKLAGSVRVEVLKQGGGGSSGSDR